MRRSRRGAGAVPDGRVGAFAGVAVAAVTLSLHLGLTAEARESDRPTGAAGEGSRREATAPGSPRTIAGGFGRPSGAPEARAGGGVEGGAEEGAGDATRAAPEDPETTGKDTVEKPGEAAKPPARVRLPEAGTYRAPRILRLAGRLAGLRVVVAAKELNDVEVEISEKLAGREVGPLDLRFVLGRHSLFLHEFDHPKRGPLLVASAEPDWRPPEPPVYRKTIESHPRVFTALSGVVLDEVEKRNAALPAGVPRYVAVPAERVSKIFLWGPSRRGVEEISSLTERFDAVLEDRPRLHAYRGRHERADRLVEPLLERLTEGERERVRVSVARWNNTIVFRAREEVAGKIRRILEQIDRPGRFSRR